jgi:hypothetical protein
MISADLLGAYALLLTTVALLQTLWYPDITAALKSLDKMPHYREDAIKLWQENRGVFHREALPLLIATIASLLAFIGPAIGVVGRALAAVGTLGAGVFGHYNPIEAAFVLVTLMSIYVGVLQGVQVYGFIRQRRLIGSLPPAGG